MDLSLDELIKKNKPEKKKGANNNSNSSKNKKKGRETRTIVVGTEKAKTPSKGQQLERQ